MDIELYIKKKKKEKRFIKKGGCLLSSNRYRKEKIRERLLLSSNLSKQTNNLSRRSHDLPDSDQVVGVTGEQVLTITGPN